MIFYFFRTFDDDVKENFNNELLFLGYCIESVLQLTNKSVYGDYQLNPIHQILSHQSITQNYK